jgi:hypothetical protein
MANLNRRLNKSIINYSPESKIIDIPSLNNLTKRQVLEISTKIKAQNAL